VVSQEHEERETEATLGKTACAAMTCHATIGEQLHARFALIKILSVGTGAGQHRPGNGKQTTSQRRSFQCYAHAAVILRPTTFPVVLNYARYMAEAERGARLAAANSTAGLSRTRHARLVPGIHVLGHNRKKDVDGRDKPGHDVK